jgi:hypothetical protein
VIASRVAPQQRGSGQCQTPLLSSKRRPQLKTHNMQKITKYNRNSPQGSKIGKYAVEDHQQFIGLGCEGVQQQKIGHHNLVSWKETLLVLSALLFCILYEPY